MNPNQYKSHFKVHPNKTSNIKKIGYDIDNNNFDNGIQQNNYRNSELKPAYVEKKKKINRGISIVQLPTNKVSSVNNKNIKPYKHLFSDGTIALLNIGDPCFFNAALQN